MALSTLNRNLAQTCALILLGLAAPLAASAAIQQVNALPGRPDSASYAIKNATSPNYCSFPSVAAFDVDNAGATVKKVLLAWNLNGDGIGTLTINRSKSLDGGLSFDTSVNSPEALAFLSTIRQRNGTVVQIPFSVAAQPFTYHTSTNNGDTWITHTDGTCNTSIVMHRGIIEENDGTIYTVGYSGGNVKIVKSTNGGTTWTKSGLANVANVNVPTSGLTYSESTIARCLDGSWLVVMRVDTAGNMRYARSTNQGVSWTTPALLPSITADGKAPYLCLLPNGILALSWGQGESQPKGRDCHLAFSADGSGAGWSNNTTLLTAVQDVTESTGYSNIYPMGPNRLMYVSDTGTSWDYASYSASRYKVWGKIVDVVPTNVNRIDLKGRVAAGTATITTDLTYSNATHPEARTSGAYDGSADYWSGAFKSGTSGTYTVDLQQARTLNAIGVCLHYNNSESATIDVSTNGTSWSTVKTYTNATHNAINYTSITAQPVRYVRVSVNGAGSLVCLNELQLYETADTFENNAVGIPGIPHGAIPPGYVANGTSATQYGFAVRDSGTAAGYQSDRCLQMWDGSSTWRCGIKKTVTASTSKTFQFRIKPLGYDASLGALQFILNSGTSSVLSNGRVP